MQQLNKFSLLSAAGAAPKAGLVPPLCPDRSSKQPDPPPCRELHPPPHTINKIGVSLAQNAFSILHLPLYNCWVCCCVCLFLIYASGDGSGWSCSTVQNPAPVQVSSFRGAELWGGQHSQAGFPALPGIPCRNSVKSSALLSKMGIIIIPTSGMADTLLINVCQDSEIPGRKAKCITQIHGT